ncbi:MAG: hypothetical protein IPL31_00075 [Saprospiraceae bacterium]|nr:hypothetical protein [Saprospiraceae bacterium]
MKWENTNNRFVAFFDIMGFKTMVQNNSHDEIVRLMTEISTIVKNMDSKQFGAEPDNVVKTTIFSDSIIITSNTDSISSAANLMYQSSYLFRTCLDLGIPIKGSISYGKFTADFTKSIFFGQPLIDAFLLEEELNLYSIVLHHSFESFLMGKEYGQAIFPNNIRWFKFLTPFKNGKSNHYHLNWIFYLSAKEQEELEHQEMLLNKFYNTVSGKTRSYVDNTLELFEKMKVRINVK